MSSIGAEEGVIKSDENKMIQNLMTLKSKRVDDVMTPRTVLTMVDENIKMKDFPIDCNHTRIPVYSGTMDNITGFVMRPDVLKRLASDDFISPISSIKRNILIFPETLSVTNALEKFMSKRAQIAIVVDEFGALQGIVTMEDIIETLLGREIVDESDTVDDMQKLAIDNFEKRRASVEES
jgi:CBS domain containing-hemolysin-like protein